MGAKSGAQYSGARGRQPKPDVSLAASSIGNDQAVLEQAAADDAREFAISKRRGAMGVLVTLMEDTACPAPTRRQCARDVLEYADRAKVGTPDGARRGRAGLVIQIVNLTTGEHPETVEIPAQQIREVLEVFDLDPDEEWEPAEQLPVPDFAGES